MPRLILLAAIPCVLTVAVNAQQNRINTRIDNSQRLALKGHVPRLAQPQYDQGAVAGSFPLKGVIMYLKPSASQQAALTQLLHDQQTPASPQFHKWLTPEQFADQFGASQDDLNTISTWLTSQGFSVTHVARSRSWITFNTTAGQARTGLRTEIHRYVVNGEIHFANATDPQLPVAIAGMVSGFRGLNDFRMKPRNIRRANPLMNTGRGAHNLAPDDFATIYNVAPLYQAGVDGTGQSLIVVGQTAIKMSDINSFRSKFGLSAANVQQVLVPGQPDPGVVSGDNDEANLDIEWSGAVARNATVIFVYSNDVWTSATYAIDQNLAPVLSMSYGLCEGLDLADVGTEEALAQQANAQGITWLAASGDNGAADCEDQSSNLIQSGPAVDIPASMPEVTGMGGTEFYNDLGTAPYWASSQNVTTSASALSYIPEKVWNDATGGQGFAAGGGGVSSYFLQPAWQTGPGVPNDGFRHVPDLSLSSSADHDGYYVFTGGSSSYFGGTSVAAPTMAGIVTLLNHYLVSTGAQKQAGVGNINPAIYQLAQTAPQAFNDVTTGNNSDVCADGSPSCTDGLVGYSAGPGYDMATGLGSVNAYNFVHAWTTNPTLNSAVMVSVDNTTVYQQGSNWPVTITLNEEAGIGTTVTGLTANGTSYDVAKVFGSTTIPPRGTLVSKNFALTNLSVPTTVTFTLTGVDASGNKWSQQFSLPVQGTQVHVSVAGVSNAASGQQVYAPGEIISVYGTALGQYVQPATATPLPTYLAGLEATFDGGNTNVPLYYVSPNQVNLQIPYNTPTGPARLTIGNPFENAPAFTIQITSAAPGIFMNNGFTTPFATAQRGTDTTIFITGDGKITPSLPPGTAPAPGETVKPRFAPTVTVGGVQATVTYYGIPSWSVGVTQINFTVPSSVSTGDQPVLVTVNGIQSNSAKVTVQ